ncbi:MAG: serine protease [Pseudomonadota bacterium]
MTQAWKWLGILGALTSGVAAEAQAESALSGVLKPIGAGSVMSYVYEAKKAGTLVEDGGSTRIYGGRPAEDGSWPWQVSLHGAEKMGDDVDSRVLSQFCGGSLIARQWVLTAAHCVQDFEGNVEAPDAIMVRSGNVALWEGDVRKVAAVIPHPDYNPVRIDHDIALLKLADPVTASSGPVGAIPVLKDGTQLQPGPAVSIGWGLMETGEVPGVLMETDIDVVPNETCNAGMAEQTKRDIATFLLSIGEINEIPETTLEQAFQILAPGIGNALTDNMICAGVASGERSSCHGDSGGPLMMQREDGGWIQVGIVSWGKPPLAGGPACGLPSLYGVYTRVSNYFNWIGQTIQSN